MLRDELVRYIDGYLEAGTVQDYCPNGLQVEGHREVHKIVCGVTASLALIDAAVERGADALLVHHGILWGGSMPPVTRSFQRRLKALLAADLNLIAYHLPLDRHPVVGNGATVAERIGLVDVEPFGKHRGITVGVKGRLPEPLDIDQLGERVARSLSADGVVFPYGPSPVRTVGVVTGAADKELPQAVAEGLDCFVTGEISEYVMHYALEEGIHFIAAGHHATERFGVQALAKHVAERFNLQWEFVDVPNPA